MPEYCAWPLASLDASLEVISCTAASASRPAISICPMWLTSNSPARVRTAMCSSTIPEYSTGMSHPPNSTIRAPSDRCAAFSGVFLSVPGWVIVRFSSIGRSSSRRGRAKPESWNAEIGMREAVVSEPRNVAATT